MSHEDSKKLKILIDENIVASYKLEAGSNLESIEQALGDIADIHCVSRLNALGQGTSDKNLYNYARQNEFDLILSFDAKCMYEDDLCTIANRAFKDTYEDVPPPIPVVILKDALGVKNIKFQLLDNKAQIIDLAHEKDMAVLDVRDVPEGQNITGTHVPEMINYTPVFERFNRGTLEANTSKPSSSERGARNTSSKSPNPKNADAKNKAVSHAPGQWLKNYMNNPNDNSADTDGAENENSDGAPGQWLKNYMAENAKKPKDPTP